MPDSDEEGGVDDEVLCISTDDESDEEEEAAQAKPGRSAKNDALSEVNKEEINEALQETAENDTDLVNMKVRDASVRSGTVQEDEGEGGMIENMLNNGAFLDQNIDDQGANYRLSSPSTAQIAEQDRLLEAEHDELEEDIPNDLTESHTDKTVDAKSNLVPNSPVVKREEDEDEGNLPNTPEANSFTSSNPVIPSSITMSAEVSFHTTITTQNHHHPFEAEFDNQSNASRSPTLPSSFQDAFREIEEDLSQAEERRLARMPRFGEFSPL